MVNIVFSPPSVRAIRAGTKDVTRRVADGDPCPYNVGDRLRVLEAWATSPDGAVWYSSTYEVPDGWVRHHARTMPPELARMFLEVVSVRVERLHAIDGRDAVREGMPPSRRNEPTARERFVDYWNTLHGAGAWERNEFVWRIEFKIAEAPNRSGSVCRRHVEHCDALAFVPTIPKDVS